MILFCLASFCLSAQSLLPHLYLTFEEENTSRSITVNFHSYGSNKDSLVYFGKKSAKGISSQYDFKVEGRTSRLKKVDKTFHHVKLDGLTPNTTYYFIAGSEKLGFTKEYKFKTLPEDDSPIRIVSGGDMGTSSLIGDVSESAVSVRPDVILIGGDISYANAKIENHETWDKWFYQMRRVIMTSDDYIIPMIVAVGNHETTTGFALPFTKAPFYTKFFPQANGKTYFLKHLGQNTVLLVLDSGHVKSHRQQRGFIKRALSKYQDIPYRLALYHAPLYPNHRSFSDILSNLGRTFWLELFDKYNLTAAFENHDHTLKRTKVLKGDKVVDKGTVYVGDGCWGKNPREAHPDRWYLEKGIEASHVWSLNITNDNLEFLASGVNGEVFDHFTLKNSLTNTQITELLE